MSDPVSVLVVAHQTAANSALLDAVHDRAQQGPVMPGQRHGQHEGEDEAGRQQRLADGQIEVPERPGRQQVAGRQGVQGVRCGTCRYPVAQTGIPWCPACYGPVAPARFTPTGTVWSATVVAIPVGPLRPPFGLAYLDLDDGPRILVRLAEPRVLPPGTRLRITGTDCGDLVAAEERAS